MDRRLPFTFHALDFPLLTNQVPQPKRRNMMKNIYRFALMLVVAMFVIGSTGCGKTEEAPAADETDAADAATENADAGADETDAEK